MHCGVSIRAVVIFVQVGELLLRNFVFIHLTQPGDKFHLLLAMVHKLYAMVMGQCADDNPDAMIHHEVEGFPVCFTDTLFHTSGWRCVVQ